MVVLFPGLGCEYAGMTARFAGRFPWAEGRLSEWFGPERAAEILTGDGLEVKTPVEELALQRRIHAMNLLWWEACLSGNPPELAALPPARAFCGHSLGFYAALVAAGCLSPADSMSILEILHSLCARDASLVGKRGAWVLLCAKGYHAGDLVADPRLEPLAVNTDRQAVVCADPDSFAAFTAERADALYRVSPVRILTPIHSASLKAAGRELARRIEDIPFADPAAPLWSHTTGRRLPDAAAARREVADQVSRPVRWDLLMAALARAGERRFLEAGPNRILTQMLSQMAGTLEEGGRAPEGHAADFLRKQRDTIVREERGAAA